MSKEAMKQWLRALEDYKKHTAGVMIPHTRVQGDKAIASLRQAIAEAEKQEPVGEVSKAGFGDYPVICWRKGYVAKIGDKFYTTPPQRKPLTLEQLREHWQVAKVLDMTDAEIDFADYVLITRDVEALHGIKE